MNHAPSSKPAILARSIAALLVVGTNAAGIISISQTIQPINPANPIEHIP